MIDLGIPTMRRPARDLGGPSTTADPLDLRCVNAALTRTKVDKGEALEIDLQARKCLVKERGSCGIKAGVVDVFPAPAVHQFFRGNQAAGVGSKFGVEGMHRVELLSRLGSTR